MIRTYSVVVVLMLFNKKNTVFHLKPHISALFTIAKK